MVGEDAAALRRALEITYPLENGVIRVSLQSRAIAFGGWLCV